MHVLNVYDAAAGDAVETKLVRGAGLRKLRGKPCRLWEDLVDEANLAVLMDVQSDIDRPHTPSSSMRHTVVYRIKYKKNMHRPRRP